MASRAIHAKSPCITNSPTEAEKEEEDDRRLTKV